MAEKLDTTSENIADFASLLAQHTVGRPFDVETIHRNLENECRDLDGKPTASTRITNGNYVIAPYQIGTSREQFQQIALLEGQPTNFGKPRHVGITSDNLLAVMNRVQASGHQVVAIPNVSGLQMGMFQNVRITYDIYAQTCKNTIAEPAYAGVTDGVDIDTSSPRETLRLALATTARPISSGYTPNTN